MATVEKLQEHLKKPQSNLAEASKITATEKMAELKKKKKKDRKTTSE